MKKLNKKSFVGLLVFFIILIAISLFIGYGVPIIRKQTYTEEKTTEYTATFKSKETYNEGYILYLNNYKCYLTVNSSAIINESRFNNLKNGEKITFRSIFDFEKISQEEYPFDILSLSTDDAEIVTLESSKNVVTEADIKIRLTATVFSIFFLIGAIICILYIVGVLKTKQKTKTE